MHEVPVEDQFTPTVPQGESQSLPYRLNPTLTSVSPRHSSHQKQFRAPVTESQKFAEQRQLQPLKSSYRSDAEALSPSWSQYNTRSGNKDRLAHKFQERLARVTQQRMLMPTEEKRKRTTADKPIYLSGVA